MKRSIVFSLALSIVLLTFSCTPGMVGVALENCGEVENVKLGALEFYPTIDVLLPYDGSSSFTFENENGDLVTFPNHSYLPSDIKLEVEYLCGSSSDWNRKVSYYDFEFQRFMLDNLVTNGASYDNFCSLRISKTIRVVRDELPEQEYLYDEISLSGHINGAATGPLKLILPRENSETFPQQFLDDNQDFDFDSSLELNGEVYHNVYSATSEASIYMNSEHGIIGIMDATGVFWKLQ